MPPSRRPGWSRRALQLAICVLTLSPLAAQEDIRIVASISQLKEAFLEGAQLIKVVEHLIFSKRETIDDDILLGSGPLLGQTIIWGACEQPPPLVWTGAKLVKEGQCILDAFHTGRFFVLRGNESRLWISNLVLVRSTGDRFFATQPKEISTQLYSQGGSILVMEGARLYMQNAVVYQSTASSGGAVAVLGGFANFTGVDFIENVSDTGGGLTVDYFYRLLEPRRMGASSYIQSSSFCRNSAIKAYAVYFGPRSKSFMNATTFDENMAKNASTPGENIEWPANRTTGPIVLLSDVPDLQKEPLLGQNGAPLSVPESTFFYEGVPDTEFLALAERVIIPIVAPPAVSRSRKAAPARFNDSEPFSPRLRLAIIVCCSILLVVGCACTMITCSKMRRLHYSRQDYGSDHYLPSMYQRGVPADDLLESMDHTDVRATSRSATSASSYSSYGSGASSPSVLAGNRGIDPESAHTEVRISVLSSGVTPPNAKRALSWNMDKHVDLRSESLSAVTGLNLSNEIINKSTEMALFASPVGSPIGLLPNKIRSDGSDVSNPYEESVPHMPTVNTSISLQALANFTRPSPQPRSIPPNYVPHSPGSPISSEWTNAGIAPSKLSNVQHAVSPSISTNMASDRSFTLAFPTSATQSPQRSTPSLSPHLSSSSTATPTPTPTPVLAKDARTLTPPSSDDSDSSNRAIRYPPMRPSPLVVEPATTPARSSGASYDLISPYLGVDIVSPYMGTPNHMDAAVGLLDDAADAGGLPNVPWETPAFVQQESFDTGLLAPAPAVFSPSFRYPNDSQYPKNDTAQLGFNGPGSLSQAPRNDTRGLLLDEDIEDEVWHRLGETDNYDEESLQNDVDQDVMVPGGVIPKRRLKYARRNILGDEKSKGRANPMSTGPLAAAMEDDSSGGAATSAPQASSNPFSNPGGGWKRNGSKANRSTMLSGEKVSRRSTRKKAAKRNLLNRGEAPSAQLFAISEEAEIRYTNRGLLYEVPAHESVSGSGRRKSRQSLEPIEDGEESDSSSRSASSSTSSLEDDFDCEPISADMTEAEDPDMEWGEGSDEGNVDETSKQLDMFKLDELAPQAQPPEVSTQATAPSRSKPSLQNPFDEVV